MQYLDAISKATEWQGKPFNIMVIQVYAPNSNAEEAEVEWFYEDLQDLLELTPTCQCDWGWKSNAVKKNII